MTADCMDADSLLRGRDYEIDCFEQPQSLPAAPEKAGSRYQLLLLDIEPGVLSALASALPGRCFRRCHHSFFLNLSHVTGLARYRARADNGQVIPVSKRFYQDTLQPYFAFLKN
nr:LytTR family DNA-binding domain-containing protein [uncultured Oscillibacter sp.]